MSALPVSAREGYDLWAGAWDDTPSPIVALEARAVKPWLDSCLSAARPGLRTLDVGCGTGRWTAYLGALGLDLSAAMLAVAAAKPGLRGRLAVADAAALPVSSASAGLLLCSLTFGHIPNPSDALHEFARVLAPGGRLILTDFHPAAIAQGWRRTFRREAQVYEVEHHPYTLDSLRRAAAGFTLREHIDAVIGLPERPLFDRAGRPELFASAIRVPSVLLTLWERV